MRLLLVEDHPELAKWLVDWLTQVGFIVEHLDRGDRADLALKTERYDLVVLDLSLPGLDGLDVLRRLRDRGDITPVLVLTARGTKDDRVRGLNLGADDYLPKPFELDELEARIKALLRRSGGQTPKAKIGSLVLDTLTREVMLDGKPLQLTPRELAVLEALAARLGHPVARETVFKRVFEFDSDARIESIEIYVHRLRKKIEGSGATIVTLRGLGYALSVDGRSGAA
ncbi:MAG: response regulator [Burkholderiaceae bacterium]|jgi:two-component system response regulator TctD|nr:response regulator [Burkholderiaceae bacterium]